MEFSMRTDSARSDQKTVTETATEARQGNFGKPVLIVLVSGLLLAFVAWGAVEWWGKVLTSIISRPHQQRSTRSTRSHLEKARLTTIPPVEVQGHHKPPIAIRLQVEATEERR